MAGEMMGGARLIDGMQRLSRGKSKTIAYEVGAAPTSSEGGLRVLSFTPTLYPSPQGGGGRQRCTLSTCSSARLRGEKSGSSPQTESCAQVDTKSAGLEGSERKFAELGLDRVEADGTFSGYASLFGKVDLVKDVVERGAFAASLRTRGAADVRMLYQHDPNQPIGAWTEIREDARGLFVRGRLNTDTGRGREVLSLMRGKALDGLSIGFRTVRARKDEAKGVRRILEVDLWEISVVTFPMLPEARVAQVKGRLPTIREFEHWLTRDAGLTRSDARMVIAKGFASLRRVRDAAAMEAGGLAGAIRAATRLMQKDD